MKPLHTFRIGTDLVDPNPVVLRDESTLIRFSVTPRAELKFYEDVYLMKKFIGIILDNTQVVNNSKVLSGLIQTLNPQQRYDSLRKVQGAVKSIKKILDKGKQVCVFILFRDTTVHIQNAFKRKIQATIYPDTPKEKRRNSLKRFKDGKVKLLIMQHSAVDHSVDLSHVNNLIFVDLSYSNATNVQALSRCINIKQTRHVDVRTVALRDEIDARYAHIAAIKMRAYITDGILRA